MGLNPLSEKFYSVIWNNLEIQVSQNCLSHSHPETPGLTVIPVYRNLGRSNTHLMSTLALDCHNLDQDDQTEKELGVLSEKV